MGQRRSANTVRPLGALIAALLAVGTTGWMPAAASGAETAGEPRAVPNELLVTYQPGATQAQKATTRRAAKAVATELVAGGAHGAREVELVTLAVGQSVAGAARRLQADPAVVAAEPNWIYTTEVTPSEPYFTNGSLWGMNGGYGSGASTAWAANHTGSTGVYVGVIDEGIQFTHPDLDANVWTNPFDPADGIDNDGNGYVDDVHGWDFANRDNSIYDGGSKASLDNHGTHVSGTIGAEANGTGVVGVSWNVTLISGKFLGRRGGTTADAIKAVDYFTDLKTRHGLNIVATNNSWSGGSYSKALSDAIERANAANILFVAAAGNGGSDGAGDNNDTAATYPASYANSNVIAVAAIDAQGNRASFSNYGATTVDLGAPGVGVLSTTAESTYSNYSGTSMAAPHVTGAAALYASTHPGATATQIKQAILATAIPTPSLQGKTVTGGRLDTSSF